MFCSLTEEGSMYHFVLKIDELRVTDEGQYICQISINKSNLKSTVDIYINRKLFFCLFDVVAFFSSIQTVFNRQFLILSA